MNFKACLTVLVATTISGCALLAPPRHDQAGRVADRHLELRDPEIDKLAEHNLQLRRDQDDIVMDPPAREGSGIVSEVDIGKALNSEQGKQASGKGKATAVKLEFSDTSLKDIIVVFMQDYLKQPYTFQESFKDTKVNLFFNAKATREDLIRLFDTLLENYGIRLRYSGGVYLVGSVEDKTTLRALQQPSPLGIGDAVGVFRVNFLDAGNFIPLAKQVVKYPEKISVLPGNVIIVNSTSTDVRAVHTLLEDIDTPTFSGKYILAYSPRYLSAPSLVALLDNTQNQLMGAQNASRQFEAKQLPETDRLIIVAANKTARDLVVQFLAQTDVVGGNHRRVFQYNLATQTAADVVSNLQALIKAVIKNASEIVVVPDKVSNSLFINASPEEYAEIRRLLTRLDFRPPSVEVDMVIAEVNLNEEMRYGVEWYLKKKMGQAVSDAITGLGLPVGTTANLATTIVNSSNYATLQLLGSQTTYSLLSNPKIVVKNGATAKISVGSEQPVIKQKTSTPATTGISTVVEPEFKKIGIDLEVTPYVTPNNEVRMIIKLKDTDITGSQTLGTDSYPILSSRELSTDLVAGDGKTIFLGGIRKQSISDIASKIPGLADLPGVGALFRNKDMTDFGKELIILATPTVMLDQQGADIVTRAVLRASKQEFAPLSGSQKQGDGHQPANSTTDAAAIPTTPVQPSPTATTAP